MEKVHFTEEKATMLATLYGRALDYRSADPVLGDKAADDAVRRIDYDFSKLGADQNIAIAVVMRARPIDQWAREFLDSHPDAVVLHLGCGMDSRVYRLDPPSTVAWFDVDYPEVVELRRKLYPEREGYTQIGSSVTDFTWMDQIPTGRPTLMVAEGLSMYLKEQEGEELLRRIVERFGHGEMIFDMFSKAGIKMQKLNPVVRKSGSTLYWGIDDPRDLERLGLQVVTVLDAAATYTDQDLQRVSAGIRFQLRITKLIPGFRKLAHIVRYRY